MSSAEHAPAACGLRGCGAGSIAVEVNRRKQRRAGDARLGIGLDDASHRNGNVEIRRQRFFDEVEAGVCYANKRTGATTGAWPGAQPFCGWKGSGSTGKGGCGPYYVQQFLREQSRTVIETA